MVSEFPLASWNLASLVDESRHVSTYELDEHMMPCDKEDKFAIPTANAGFMGRRWQHLGAVNAETWAGAFAWPIPRNAAAKILPAELRS